jgi:hypothetical protein
MTERVLGPKRSRRHIRLLCRRPDRGVCHRLLRGGFEATQPAHVWGTTATSRQRTDDRPDWDTQRTHRRGMTPNSATSEYRLEKGTSCRERQRLSTCLRLIPNSKADLGRFVSRGRRSAAQIFLYLAWATQSTRWTHASTSRSTICSACPASPRWFETLGPARRATLITRFQGTLRSKATSVASSDVKHGLVAGAAESISAAHSARRVLARTPSPDARSARRIPPAPRAVIRRGGGHRATRRLGRGVLPTGSATSKSRCRGTSFNLQQGLHRRLNQTIIDSKSRHLRAPSRSLGTTPAVTDSPQPLRVLFKLQIDGTTRRIATGRTGRLQSACCRHGNTHRPRDGKPAAGSDDTSRDVTPPAAR